MARYDIVRDYTSRLQVLEKHFCMKPIPTIDQFKKAWAEADPLSRSVLAALAESGDFDGLGKSWSRYMTAEPDGPIGEDGEPADVGADVVGMRVLEHPEGLPVGPQQADGEKEPVDHQSGRQRKRAPLPAPPVWAAHADRTGHGGKCQAQPQVAERAPAGKVAVVEQRHHGRTEEPVAEEVGGQVQQDGGVGVFEP